MNPLDQSPDFSTPSSLGVAGVKVGHAQSERGRTGCTVVLCEKGATVGVAIAGSAPVTRETELLGPNNLLAPIHALLLSGGSTFGLSAAAGVQAHLVAQKIGFRAATGVVVPLVPAAAIYDLDVGHPQVYPDNEMGLRACDYASEDATLQGSVGAGCGALCGKALGTAQAMPGGLGVAHRALPNGVQLGALAVCNCWGDVVDPRANSEIVAGARCPPHDEFLDTNRWLREQNELDTRFCGMDTTLCVVATNARFDREQATAIAKMAHDGIARATCPAHTPFDGDLVFTLCTGERPADLTVVGTAAADLVAQAIVNGVHKANAQATSATRRLPKITDFEEEP